MRIAYFLFGHSPSTAVRATDFSSLLRARGIQVDWIQAYPETILKRAQSPASHLGSRLIRKFCSKLLILTLLVGLLRIIVLSPKLKGIVVVKFCPPWVMRFLKLARTPVMYDFDDAVWLDQYMGEKKFKALVTRADFVSADNSYLSSKASEYNKNSFVVPGSTAQPLFAQHLKGFQKNNLVPVIGWVGSPSTVFYLEAVKSAINQLNREGLSFELRLVGCPSGIGRSLFPEVKLTCRESYNQQCMIDEVTRFDIGLFPISNDPQALGRGAHKVRIYFSARVAVVASRYGEAVDLVDHMRNGCLVENNWEEALRLLITDRPLRESLAQSGFDYAQHEFAPSKTIDAIYSHFLNKV